MWPLAPPVAAGGTQNTVGLTPTNCMATATSCRSSLIRVRTSFATASSCHTRANASQRARAWYCSSRSLNDVSNTSRRFASQ
jgi:hypothetical protein